MNYKQFDEVGHEVEIKTNYSKDTKLVGETFHRLAIKKGYQVPDAEDLVVMFTDLMTECFGEKNPEKGKEILRRHFDWPEIETLF